MINPNSNIDLKQLQNLNVLYVEDDSVVASQTLKLLHYFFGETFHSTTAENAIDILHEQTIHMVITDIQLPGMSGLELCSIIRETYKDLPIFVTSAHNEIEILLEAIKLNLVDYLIKPLSIATLTKTLHASLVRMKDNGLLSIQINSRIRFYPLLGILETSEGNVALTRTEIDLLNILLQNKNKIVDRSLLEYTLAPDRAMSDSAYKNLIYRLRKKMGKESIVSVSNVGLKLIIHA